MPQTSSEETLLQRGKWTYILALLLIAAINLGSHLLIDSIIHREADTARIVNLSGRQRMLSQRIVKIALERAVGHAPNGDAAKQRALREAVTQISAVHAGLLHGSTELRLPPAPPTIREVYTGQRWKLDAQIQHFLVHAHRLADEPATVVSLSDPDLHEIEEETRRPLLDALDAAVVAEQQYSEHSIERSRTLLALLTTLMIVIVLAEALLVFRPLFQRLGRQQQHLLSIGRTDPLTGCFNRRAFEEFAAAALDRARRAGEPLSLLSLDLDHFKQVNDTHGHAAGDLVLKSFAATLTHLARSSDLLCRIGGEEFVLILPHTPHETLAALADRFRKAVESSHVPFGAAQLPVTVSIGAATLHASDRTFDDLLGRADRAVYLAKRTGRNRVQLAPVPDDASASTTYTPHQPISSGLSIRRESKSLLYSP